MNEMLKIAAPHVLNGVKVVAVTTGKIAGQIVCGVIVATVYVAATDKVGSIYRRVMFDRRVAALKAAAEAAAAQAATTAEAAAAAE